MKLIDFLEKLKSEGLVKTAENFEQVSNVDIKGLTYDSRKVIQGSLFVCKGEGFKPEYLRDALENGAVCYISEKSYDFTQEAAIIVKDIRKAMATVAAEYYDYSFKKLKLIGITGTKGKSSTAYFLKSMLDYDSEVEGKPETALISGIEVFDGKQRYEANLTTPEAIELHAHFKNAVDSKSRYCTMEVSSQALKYDRTLGIEFDAGVFLNLGEDHISSREHESFEDYKEAKLRLMGQSKNVYLNMDDAYYEEFLKKAEESECTEGITGFSISNDAAQVCAKNIKRTESGMKFLIRIRKGGMSLVKPAEIKLAGEFNVTNALAASAVAFDMGLPLEHIVEGLKRTVVPGRMEMFFDDKRQLSILVDYAHNKMSFEALFADVRKNYDKNSIAIVFGCPGGKATGRRKELAEIAALNAGRIYITEEDSDQENVEDISAEIVKNICDYDGICVVDDVRESAIHRAIDESRAGDIVLITGKGREKVQKRDGKYVEVKSDLEIVKEIISNRP